MSTTFKLYWDHSRNFIYLVFGLILVVLVMIGSKSLPGPYQFPVALSSVIVLALVIGLMTITVSYEARGDRLLELIYGESPDNPNLWFKESMMTEEVPIEGGAEDRYHKVIRLTKPMDFSQTFLGEENLTDCMDVILQYSGTWQERTKPHEGYGTMDNMPVGHPGMDTLFVDPVGVETFLDIDGVQKTAPAFEVLFSVGADQKLVSEAVKLFWKSRKMIIRSKPGHEQQLVEELNRAVMEYAMTVKHRMEQEIIVR